MNCTFEEKKNEDIFFLSLTEFKFIYTHVSYTCFRNHFIIKFTFTFTRWFKQLLCLKYFLSVKLNLYVYKTLKILYFKNCITYEVAFICIKKEGGSMLSMFCFEMRHLPFFYCKIKIKIVFASKQKKETHLVPILFRDVFVNFSDHNSISS